MSLNWNEIKLRAVQFTKEWGDETRERAEKDTFWNQFMNVFGISRRRVAYFEHSVKKLNDKQGFVDLFMPGTLLVEHKSRGKNLDSAFGQALDYFPGIEEHDLPKYIIVSDFKRFRLYNLEEWGKYAEFEISEFLNNVHLFGFLVGYEKREYKEQDPVNIKAAEMLGELYDQLKVSGYEGDELKQLLVRLIFCLFAEDTSIFEKDTFSEVIELRTSEDGGNLGAFLTQLFQVLNTPRENRQRNLDEHLDAFPYVNGGLFSESLPIAAFNSDTRKLLLRCGALDWGKISPAIFGSVFQSVMNPEARRNLGAHYTSEKNIIKLIEPLFLDELKDEFKKVKKDKNKLLRFHDKISQLRFFDPACGCGNFLVVVYRELRLLEIEVLKSLQGKQQVLNIEAILKVQLDHFYGIEIEDFPMKIAEVAMWIMDHQMNLKVGLEFGLYYCRLPLNISANITHGNALQVDWEDIVPKDELSYIIGNPPFIGAAMKTEQHKLDLEHVFGSEIKHGKLDYVSAWYFLASKFMLETEIKTAFVSTNSITQGEQVGLLWPHLLGDSGHEIFFAHRTFNWTSEARGKAAVHCVIIGFSSVKIKRKKIFDYIKVNDSPQMLNVDQINPYLANSPAIYVTKSREPISTTLRMIRGSIPYDDGNLLLSETERDSVIKEDPSLSPLIKRYGGGKELINNQWRYCFWLVDAEPSIIRRSKILKARINACKTFRENSETQSVNRKADTPSLFGDNRQPDTGYLMFPRISSSVRKYLPIGYIDRNTIFGDTSYGVPDATLYHFGVLSSLIHNTWMRTVAGRLKNDYRYSNNLVYNTFPWPKNMDDRKRKIVGKCAQKVLDIRSKFPSSSLADLYHPLTMPAELVKAHKELDKAVDLCYRTRAFTTESERLGLLFILYQEYLVEEV